MAPHQAYLSSLQELGVSFYWLAVQQVDELSSGLAPVQDGRKTCIEQLAKLNKVCRLVGSIVPVLLLFSDFDNCTVVI